MSRSKRRGAGLLGLSVIIWFGLFSAAMLWIIVWLAIRLNFDVASVVTGSLLIGCAATGPCGVGAAGLGVLASGYGGVGLVSPGGQSAQLQADAVADVRDTGNRPHLLMSYITENGRPLGERLASYTYCVERGGGDCPFYTSSDVSNLDEQWDGRVESIELDPGIRSVTLSDGRGSLTVAASASSLQFNNEVSGIDVTEGCAVDIRDADSLHFGPTGNYPTCRHDRCRQIQRIPNSNNKVTSGAPENLNSLKLLTDDSFDWADRISSLRVRPDPAASTSPSYCTATISTEPIGKGGRQVRLGEGIHNLRRVPGNGVTSVSLDSQSGGTVTLYPQRGFRSRLDQFPAYVAAVLGDRNYHVSVIHEGTRILTARNGKLGKAAAYRYAIPVPGGEHAWLVMKISGTPGGVWWE